MADHQVVAAAAAQHVAADAAVDQVVDTGPGPVDRLARQPAEHHRRLAGLVTALPAADGDVGEAVAVHVADGDVVAHGGAQGLAEDGVAVAPVEARRGR